MTADEVRGPPNQVVARRAESNKQGPRAQTVPITDTMGGLSGYSWIIDPPPD